MTDDLYKYAKEIMENSHLDFNEHAEPIGKVFIKSNYCPNCGARMVSE